MWDLVVQFLCLLRQEHYRCFLGCELVLYSGWGRGGGEGGVGVGVAILSVPGQELVKMAAILVHFSSQVVVDCPSSGHQQIFLCQKWLADDEGDQLIERDLYESEDMRLKRRPSMFTILIRLFFCLFHSPFSFCFKLRFSHL